jgi:hypothetical protein
MFLMFLLRHTKYLKNILRKTQWSKGARVAPNNMVGSLDYLNFSFKFVLCNCYL